jgi:hypothetical protein
MRIALYKGHSVELPPVDVRVLCYASHDGSSADWFRAAWKLAPAIAAGNCVVIKPAEQTPVSISEAFKIIGDVLPKGRLLDGATKHWATMAVFGLKGLHLTSFVRS